MLQEALMKLYHGQQEMGIEILNQLLLSSRISFEVPDNVTKPSVNDSI